MKVIEDTPLRLKLQHSPLTLWWIGGSMSAISLVWLIHMIGFQPIAARFTCNRPTSTQTNCDLKHYSVLRQNDHFRIVNPQNTEIITHNGRKSRSYEIRIISPMSDLPFLPLGIGSLSENQAIAAKIDGYINNPQTRSLWVHQQDKAIFIFILGGLILLGIGISLTLTPMVTCNFYKRMDKVVIERRRWNGSTTLVEERLSNILTAELEEQHIKGGKVYRPILVMASSKRVPIHKDFTEQADRKALDCIQNFLQTKA